MSPKPCRNLVGYLVGMIGPQFTLWLSPQAVDCGASVIETSRFQWTEKFIQPTENIVQRTGLGSERI